MRLEQWIRRCRGDISCVARHLGVSRSYVYRLVRDEGLWPLVEEERRCREEERAQARLNRYREVIRLHTELGSTRLVAEALGVTQTQAWRLICEAEKVLRGRGLERES